MERVFVCICVLASVTAAHAKEFLVSDRATNRVLRYDYQTGNFLDVLVDGDPETNGGLVWPSTMVLGPNNELLVASQLTGSVLRYDLGSGNFLGEFATGLSVPSGLLYDSNRDRLYISTLGNFNSELVYAYTASTGSFLQTFGAGQGASGRTSLTLGPDSHLYVSSFANDGFFSGSVLRFNGDTLAPLGTFAAVAGLAGANGLVFQDVVGSPGNYTLDVVGLFSSTVARFNVARNVGGDLTVTGSGLLITSSLDFPSEIMPYEGTLLVTNLGNDNPDTGPLRPGSVGRFNATTGVLLNTFLPSGGPDNLSQPTDILVVPEPAGLALAFCAALCFFTICRAIKH